MPPEATSRPIDLLLVAKDPSDVQHVREALHAGKLLNRLFVVPDGEAALAFLRREAEYAHAPPPDLLLLELAPDPADCREVIACVRADADLARLPVVLLTSSERQPEALRQDGVDADGYLTKPLSVTHVLALAHQDAGWELLLVTRPRPPVLPLMLVIALDPVVRELFGMMLTVEAVAGHVAASAVEAVALPFDTVPAVILLDCGSQLPDCQASVALLRIRFGPDVPLIVLSNDEPELAEEQARRLGAFAWVRKPFDVDVLLAITYDAIARDRSQAPVRSANQGV